MDSILSFPAYPISSILSEKESAFGESLNLSIKTLGHCFLSPSVGTIPSLVSLPLVGLLGSPDLFLLGRVTRRSGILFFTKSIFL